MKAELASAMQAAWDAGLSVFPLGANKRPAVREWRPYMERRPEMDEVKVWQASDFSGYAVVMGGPERLLAIDLEADFVHKHLSAFSQELRNQELEATWDSWMAGLMVVTPSNGLHVVIHLMGDGPMPGNEKLASDRFGKCLAETRAQGGYIVGYGSNGDCHPSGKPWVHAYGGYDQITWAEPEEWAAVRAVLVSFDAAPLAPVDRGIHLATGSSPSTGGVSLAGIERSGSWIDGVELPPLAEVIAGYGWQFHHDDADYSYWTRPGKDLREGISATINANDRLHNHSSNAHPVPVSTGNRSFDAVDIIGCYELGHLPSLAERTEILRRWAPPRGRTTGTAGPAADPSAYFEADFWDSTEWLSELYVEALRRQRSPEAVLGAVLATYATITPMPFQLPAIVGDTAPLNTYVALVSRSGGGKTSSLSIARSLVAVPKNNDYKFGSLRSGEGLISMAKMPKEKGDEGQAYRRGIMVDFDEIKSLHAQDSRLGSTTLSYLSTAWSGKNDVGGAKAAGDDSFPASLVRVCVALGVQFGVAGSIFTGESAAQGFPGRFLYFGLDNPILPTLPKDASLAPPIPDALSVRHWTYDEAREVQAIAFPDHVIIATKDWDASQEPRLPIDGHRMQLRLRTAALLALMSGHVYVDDTIWDLSGEIERHSLALRQQLLSAIGDAARNRAITAGRLDAARDEGRNDEWTSQRAARLVRWMHTCEGKDSFSRKDLKGRLAAHERPRLNEVLAYAETFGWVVHRGEHYTRGPSRPS